MTLYQLKPAFQFLLRPLLRRLAAASITANQVTCFAMLASIAVGAWLFLRPSPQAFLILPVFLFLRMALNAIDGMLAREFSQQSRLGAVLNEVGDVVSDAALYLPFAVLAPTATPWVISVVLLALLTEFIGVLGLTLGASRRYDGPMGKSDRALAFGTFALIIGLYPAAIVSTNWVFATACGLLVLTCWNRSQRLLTEGAPRA